MGINSLIWLWSANVPLNFCFVFYQDEVYEMIKEADIDGDNKVSLIGKWKQQVLANWAVSVLVSVFFKNLEQSSATINGTNPRSSTEPEAKTAARFHPEHWLFLVHI